MLATFGGPHPYTETVAEGLEVLRVIDAGSGQGPIAVGSTAATTLILLVEPDQAERVAYAVAFGKLSVTVAPPQSALPG